MINKKRKLYTLTMRKRSLYKNIINEISRELKRKLNEGLFDDDDIFSEDEEDNAMLSSEQITEQLRNTMVNTLCVPDEYHTVVDGADEGLPLVKVDPENACIFYVAPFRTYTICKLGPRKRKAYKNYRYFYRYIIQLLPDGTLSMSALKSSRKPLLIINPLIYNFIKSSPFRISYFCNHEYPYQPDDYKKYIDGYQKMYLMDGLPRNSKDRSHTNLFAINFPSKIEGGEMEQYINREDAEPNILTELKKEDFMTEDYFYKFVEKLTLNGFNVSDGEGSIFTKDNFKRLQTKIISGERDRELSDINDSLSQFVADLLGEEYVEKFNLIKDYIDLNNSGKFYLKTINTLRGENKICLEETVIPLAEVNGLIPYDESLVISGKNPLIKWHYIQAAMYKILYNCESEHLNDWQNRYNLWDCCHGIDTGFGSRSIDINDTPIKILGLQSFYKLYYLIGKAIVQCEGILTDRCIGNEMSDQEFLNYNKGKNVNMNTFDFTHLTNQLKTILDRTCKKFKIKVNKKRGR